MFALDMMGFFRNSENPFQAHFLGVQLPHYMHVLRYILTSACRMSTKFLILQLTTQELSNELSSTSVSPKLAIL